MKHLEFLTKLGLREKDARIYLTLLEQNTLTVSEISKQTGIHRPALYAILPRLISGGLVKEIIYKKRKTYEAEPPEKLEKFMIFLKSGFTNVVSDLGEIYKNKDHKPNISFKKGKKGYVEFFNDVALTVPKNGLFFRYSSRKTDEENFKTSNLYNEMRTKKGFERMVITSKEKALKKDKRFDRSVRYMAPNEDLFDDNISLYIYENKVAYIDHSEKTIFSIESEKISRFQEKIFRMLWRRLPKED